MLRRASLLTAITLLAAGSLPSATLAADPEFEFVGRYDTQLIDETDIPDVTAAETVAFAKGRMYVSNATDVSIDIVDISDPSAPDQLTRIDLSSYGAAVTSVEARRNVVAAAVSADPNTAPGKVVFMNRNGSILDVATVGAGPDAVMFSPDGKWLVVANEGEPNDAYTVDPFGSISLIRVRPFVNGNGNRSHVKTLNFSAFSAGGPRADELPEDVRVFGPGASVAQDLEPEFVAISSDSRWAWVTLQENNAIAVVNLRRQRIKEIVALGFKDHSASDNGLDASDEDGAISITEWPVYGMYQPDSIAPFKIGNQTYLVTADEGDARDYDGFSEEERVKDLTLDPTAFPDGTLADDENLGRLNVTSTLGDTDDDGDYDELYSSGGRSFSIWSSSGQQLWNSGDALEQITATELPDDFNSNNEENGSFDNRSDNKGPEPEAAATGKIDGRWYAFIGLERIGGVKVFDVTDPIDPEFVQYLNTRDFGYPGDYPLPDSGPEDIKFLGRNTSPTGNPLLLVSNEITGTVTIFQMGAAPI